MNFNSQKNFEYRNANGKTNSYGEPDYDTIKGVKVAISYDVTTTYTDNVRYVHNIISGLTFAADLEVGGLLVEEGTGVTYLIEGISSIGRRIYLNLLLK